MSGCLIYAIGVEDLIMVTRIAPCGFKAKVHLQQSNDNSVNSYASLYINKSIIFVLGFYDNVAITFATSEDRRLGG